MLHPDYIWHDGALRWQTPNIGEQWVAGMVALSDQDFVDLFAAQGVTPSVAALVKSHVNEDMARCILALYRSAANLLQSMSANSLLRQHQKSCK